MFTRNLVRTKARSVGSKALASRELFKKSAEIPLDVPKPLDQAYQEQGRDE